jgi:hypothetical protein
MRVLRVLLVAVVGLALVGACGDDGSAGAGSETAGEDGGDGDQADGDEADGDQADGGGEGGGGAGGELDAEATATCIDVAIDALSRFDITDIEPDDGLDRAEEAALEQQFAAIQKANPSIAEGGECEAVLSSDPAARDEVFDGLDPELQTVLTAPLTDPPSTETSTGAG